MERIKAALQQAESLAHELGNLTCAGSKTGLTTSQVALLWGANEAARLTANLLRAFVEVQNG